MLIGCENSIKSIEPPELAELPKGLSEECEEPVRLPDRNLNQGEVTSLWATDRINLETCAEMHEAVIEFYDRRDKLVSGKNGT